MLLEIYHPIVVHNTAVLRGILQIELLLTQFLIGVHEIKIDICLLAQKHRTDGGQFHSQIHHQLLEGSEQNGALHFEWELGSQYKGEHLGLIIPDLFKR